MVPVLGTLLGLLLPTSLFQVLVWLVAIWLFHWYYLNPRNLPGPKGVPGLGYLPFMKMGKSPETFAELGNKYYGSVFSVWFGTSTEFVVLNDYNTIRKAFIDNGEAFSGRMKRPGNIEMDRYANLDLVAADGEIWREHRRFALSKFRDYGIGRSSIEPAILDEITYFLDELKKLEGRAIDPLHLLSMSVCNNVVILGMGKRFDYTDPDFNDLANYVDRFIKLAVFRIDFAFKFLRKIPGVSTFLQVDERKDTMERLNVLVEKLVKEQVKNYKEGDDSNYINAYITERKDRVKSNNYSEFFTDETLIANVRVLFIAGMETTTTTLRWAILFMILHPDIQRKVDTEIDKVIGAHRMPSYEDRGRMPYTEAVLLEVHRAGSIVPLSAPHRVTKDVEINGHILRKDQTIFPNLWGVHHDEKLFPDPMTFRPERHINEQGQLVRPDALIPFSLGKRFCLGEPLARMELFLYFACIMQRFRVEAPDNVVLRREYANAGIRGPISYEARFIPRK